MKKYFLWSVPNLLLFSIATAFLYECNICISFFSDWGLGPTRWLRVNFRWIPGMRLIWAAQLPQTCQIQGSHWGGRNMPLCLGGSCMLQCCAGYSIGPPAGLFWRSIGLHPQISEQLQSCHVDGVVQSFPTFFQLAAPLTGEPVPCHWPGLPLHSASELPIRATLYRATAFSQGFHGSLHARAQLGKHWCSLTSKVAWCMVCGLFPIMATSREGCTRE